MGESARLRLIIADPHGLVRDGIRAAVETEPGLEVSDEAETRDELLAAVSRARPDVLLVDLALAAGPEGPASVFREIHDRAPGCRIVILSALEDDAAIAAAIRAGADGHLPKDAFREEIGALIHG